MYELEQEKLIKRIKDKKHKIVLLQFPDGLKPESKKIVDQIRKETDAEVLIWLGSCFGACDTPLGLEQLKIDFVVQWGHNNFRKIEGW
jgi:diphthamide biosynthesis enzyme Dph1/Dph2-like protein